VIPIALAVAVVLALGAGVAWALARFLHANRPVRRLG